MVLVCRNCSAGVALKGVLPGSVFTGVALIGVLPRFSWSSSGMSTAGKCVYWSSSDRSTATDVMTVIFGSLNVLPPSCDGSKIENY